jgi:hypothetical protein
MKSRSIGIHFLEINLFSDKKSNYLKYSDLTPSVWLVAKKIDKGYFESEDSSQSNQSNGVTFWRSKFRSRGANAHLQGARLVLRDGATFSLLSADFDRRCWR